MRRDHAYLKQSGLRIIATEHINDRTAGFRLDGLTVIEFAAEVEVYIMINDNLRPDRELLDLYNLMLYAIKLLINRRSLSGSLFYLRLHVQVATELMEILHPSKLSRFRYQTKTKLAEYKSRFSYRIHLVP